MNARDRLVLRSGGGYSVQCQSCGSHQGRAEAIGRDAAYYYPPIPKRQAVQREDLKDCKKCTRIDERRR